MTEDAHLAVSERLIDCAGASSDREFNPLVLGKIRTDAEPRRFEEDRPKILAVKIYAAVRKPFVGKIRPLQS